MKRDDRMTCSMCARVHAYACVSGQEPSHGTAGYGEGCSFHLPPLLQPPPDLGGQVLSPRAHGVAGQQLA